LSFVILFKIDKIRIQSAGTTSALVDIMKGMNDVMKKNNEAIDIKNI